MRVDEEIIRRIAKAEKRLEHLESLEIPIHPLPACRVYNSVSLPTVSGVWLLLTFNSERFDTRDLHSVVLNTSRLTAPISGPYQISASVRFASNDAGGRAVGIRLNGGNWIALDFRANANLGADMFAMSTEYWLNATEYVEVLAYQLSGGPLNVDRVADYSPEFAMAMFG